MNIYQRRDGRFEGRISRGKRSNGTRRFQYFFGRTKEDVREKMAKERRKRSNCQLTVTKLSASGIKASDTRSRSPQQRTII